MKKRIVTSACLALVLGITACGTSEPKESSMPDTTVATSTATETTISETSTEAASSAEMKAEEGLLDVEITLPASLFEGKSEDEIISAAKADGIKDVSVNEDGSVVYKMSKPEHKKMMEEMAQSCKETFDSFIGDESFPSIMSIESNNDFSEITVKCDKSKYTDMEAMSALALCMQGIFYQTFDCVPESDRYVVVNYVDSTNGNIIYSYDSNKLTQ